MLSNGTYQNILKQFKNKVNKNKNIAKENSITNNYLKVQDKRTACIFISKYGDYTDQNNPKEVQDIMQKYGFADYSAVAEYSYKHAN